MGGALSSTENVSDSSSNGNEKRKKSSASTTDGRPKLLSVEEYAAELNRLTSEPLSSDDATEVDEYSSDDEEEDDDDDVHSFSLPTSSRVQLAISYDNFKQEMRINIIRVNDIPGRETGGSPAYQIALSILPENKQHWKSRLRTAPNPEYLEEWTVKIPLMAIHQSTLICQIIGHFENGREYLYGETFLPLESLNLNIENVLTLNFQPKHVQCGLVAALQPKMETEANVTNETDLASLTLLEPPSVCPQTENLIHPTSNLPRILFSLRLNPTTGRLECCLQEIHLIEDIRPSKLPKRKIFVKMAIRTEEDGLVAEARSASFQSQSVIHVNETFAFSVKQYQIDEFTIEIMLMKRRRPRFRRQITIGTCKIGKFNTSLDEAEHWRQVLATKDHMISQWHKFYPIPLTLSAESSER
ncbi:unnamed protein product [Heterobilharzia americana]|nr:unnamed protein product [Heterobilharzia americana]